MCSARARRCRAQRDVLVIPQLVTISSHIFLSHFCACSSSSSCCCCRCCGCGCGCGGGCCCCCCCCCCGCRGRGRGRGRGGGRCCRCRQKVHAVVARSTFRSQNIQNTPAPDHFWKLRCRKSGRRCRAKHVSKSNCTKHTSSEPLLEVEMSKKCTPLWREAHFEVRMLKTLHVRATFGRWSVVLCGRRKGFCTLPKVSKKWGADAASAGGSFGAWPACCGLIGIWIGDGPRSFAWRCWCRRRVWAVAPAVPLQRCRSPLRDHVPWRTVHEQPARRGRWTEALPRKRAWGPKCAQRSRGEEKQAAACEIGLWLN